MSLVDNITVDVQPCYLCAEASRGGVVHLFRYTITIHNHNDRPVQLLERHWIIRSGGREEEIRGEGVLGEQPIIPSEGHICYTSGVGLSNKSGEMEGSYLMTDSGKHLFRVPIPAFLLAAPNAIN